MIRRVASIPSTPGIRTSMRRIGLPAEEHTAQGPSHPEIAATLYPAEATVKSHLGRILQKLELRDRARAVVFAYESRLIHPD